MILVRLIPLLFCLALNSAYAAKKTRKVKLVIKDKIFLITNPLMKKAVRIGDRVDFTWTEPHSDFKYYLEVYRDTGKKPISVIAVSNGVKRLIFKKKEAKKLFWRIRAVSRHGNWNTNKKKMLVPLKY